MFLYRREFLQTIGLAVSGAALCGLPFPRPPASGSLTVSRDGHPEVIVLRGSYVIRRNYRAVLWLGIICEENGEPKFVRNQRKWNLIDAGVQFDELDLKSCVRNLYVDEFGVLASAKPKPTIQQALARLNEPLLLRLLPVEECDERVATG